MSAPATDWIAEMGVDIGKATRRALGIGALALILAVVGAFWDAPGFFHSYLWAWWFWFCIALGSQGMLMVHHLSGGAWGFVIRRILEAAAATLPVVALLFLPILFGAHVLYPWTHPATLSALDADAARHKAAFLNLPFWIGRAVVYFVVWFLLAALTRRWSLAQDRTGDPAITTRFQRFCGPALFVYVVLLSLAGVDWVMSLEPRWFSTMFGFILVTEQGLLALAWANVVVSLLYERGVAPALLRERVAPKAYWDLGSLMFAFLLLWAYTSFGQFLIIWCGNEPDEALYYVHRGVAGWQWVGFGLIALHFFLPFVLLIFGGIKRRPATLGMVAAFMLLVRAVGAMWEIKPAFGVPGGNLSLFDLLLPVGIGGIWIAYFARQLAAAPLVPLRDPRLAGVPIIGEAAPAAAAPAAATPAAKEVPEHGAA